jgi:Zn-finger nucleic acid-binding protein
MQCPKDKSAMRSLPMKDFTFDACDICGGVWFDEEELKKVAQAFVGGIPAHVEAYSQILKENDVPSVTTAQKKEWPFEKGILCPIDEATTQNLVYGGD